MKPLNVYDSVNRNRLLGTHPRWAEHGDNYRFAAYERLAMCNLNPGAVNNITVSYVDLQRVVITSKDGWEAEVALVTYSKLEDLMRLREFRLPGESDYLFDTRRCGY